jgi:pyruvate,water dikinase
MNHEGTPPPAGGCAGPQDHWAWRMYMAECIAAQLDPERFGVSALYVLGSAKNATAGPSSDIDLLVHFRGNERQRADLVLWFEGWSLCLDEVNFLRTGCRTGGILDVHLVTDEDVAQRSSFAVKIGAATDAARLLPLRGRDLPSD